MDMNFGEWLDLEVFVFFTKKKRYHIKITLPIIGHLYRRSFTVNVHFDSYVHATCLVKGHGDQNFHNIFSVIVKISFFISITLSLYFKIYREKNTYTPKIRKNN